VESGFIPDYRERHLCIKPILVEISLL
jgi:hypothetical protein